MVPARNLLRRHCDSYGGCFGDATHLDFHCQPKPFMRPPLMAEEDSRTGGGGGGEGGRHEDEEEEEGEVGISSKDGGGGGGGDDDGWLQLGLGGRSTSRTSTNGGGGGGRGKGGHLMELQLFSDRPRAIPPPTASAVIGVGARAGEMGTAMPLFPSAPVRPWAFWSPSPMLASTSTPHPRQFVFAPWRLESPAGEGSSATSGMRVVSHPRRPRAGVWFVLQAAQNQGREPFLPQIPKSYLRIKDGRMTVRLLMKYLMNKLGLEDESEVEIRCRGHQLLPYWTLQYVRDHIWCSEYATFLRESPSAAAAADHVMTLQYGRRA